MIYGNVFSMIYLFGIGFLVGFMFAGFVVSDFVMRISNRIENYFIEKKKEEERIKKEKKFKKHVDGYVNVLKGKIK